MLLLHCRPRVHVIDLCLIYIYTLSTTTELNATKVSYTCIKYTSKYRTINQYKHQSRYILSKKFCTKRNNNIRVMYNNIIANNIQHINKRVSCMHTSQRALDRSTHFPTNHTRSLEPRLWLARGLVSLP